MRSSVNFHGHMYTAVFDSMESSLRDAVRRELMTQDELATQRKREAQTRSKVHLPVSEFNAETRFYRGKGGQTGTMRRQIDDRLKPASRSAAAAETARASSTLPSLIAPPARDAKRQRATETPVDASPTLSA